MAPTNGPPINLQQHDSGLLRENSALLGELNTARGLATYLRQLGREQYVLELQPGQPMDRLLDTILGPYVPSNAARFNDVMPDPALPPGDRHAQAQPPAEYDDQHGLHLLLD